MLSFNFLSLFQGEIKVLGPANYQSQETGWSVSETHAHEELKCEVNRFSQKNVRKIQEKAKGKPLVPDWSLETLELFGGSTSVSELQSSADCAVICTQLSTASQSR